MTRRGSWVLSCAHSSLSSSPPWPPPPPPPRPCRAPPGAGFGAEMARLLRERGGLDEAMTEPREATALDGDEPDAHLLLAQLYQIQAVGPEAEAGLAKGGGGDEEGGRPPSRGGAR